LKVHYPSVLDKDDHNRIRFQGAAKVEDDPQVCKPFTWRSGIRRRWQRCETVDLFGVIFDGHPDSAVGILLPERIRRSRIEKGLPVRGPSRSTA
jgi:hypothetical protein